MFTSRKQLKADLEEARIGLKVKEDRITSLDNQRRALVEENKNLRQQISDQRAEYNGAIDAKEVERQELCDQLGQTQEEVKSLTIKLNEANSTIAELRAKLNHKRDSKGRFTHKHQKTE